MAQIVRQGDTGLHGTKDPGTVLIASGSATTNGKKIAVMGDVYKCSKHGLQKIIATGSATIDGKKTAVVGDKTSCGAILIKGSPDSSVD